MKTILILFALFLATEAKSTLVINSNIELIQGGPFDPHDYQLTIYQDIAGTDPTSIFFDWTPTSLTLIAYNLDQGSEWYFTQHGDVFTSNAIAASAFTLFDIANSPHTIPTGPFYFGANTDQDDPLMFSRNIFGWAMLSNSPSGLSLISSAVGYDVPGIIIGENQLVPEPSVGLMMAFGITMMGFIRKVRRQPEG